MRSLLLLVVLTVPACAEWPRLVIDEGQKVDHPGAHPLKYFTEDPWRQDNLEPCSPRSPANVALAKANKARVELVLVGRVRRFDVHDLFYYAGDDPKPSMKSIPVIPVGLRYDDTNRCCDQGVVYVRFKLDHGRVIVLRARVLIPMRNISGGPVRS